MEPPSSSPTASPAAVVVVELAQHSPAGESSVLAVQKDPQASHSRSHSRSAPSLYYMDRCGGNSCCCFGQCSADGFHPAVGCCTTRAWWRDFVLGLPAIDGRRIVESYFVSPTAVLGVRVLLTLYATIVFLAASIYSFGNGYIFVFFTHLSYLGLTVYFWMATWLSVERWRKPELYIRLQKARPIDIFTSIMYTTSFTFHILVTVVYWTLLIQHWYSLTATTEKWATVSQHGMDFALIFVEFFLNRIVYSWGHLLIAYVVLYLYLFWTFLAPLLWPTSGPYGNGVPYFFVDVKNPATFAYIAGLSVVLLLFWTLSTGMHWCKVVVARKYNNKE